MSSATRTRRWTRGHAGARFASGSILALLAFVACAPSGHEIEVRLSAAGPESGVYTLRYLEPPWELVSQAGERTALRIPSNAMAMLGPDAGGLTKYEVAATLQPGTPAALAETRRREAEASGDLIVFPVRAVTTNQGAQGLELATRGEGPPLRHRRFVFLPITGRTLVLFFEATPELATREVDAMIAAVEIAE